MDDDDSMEIGDTSTRGVKRPRNEQVDPDTKEVLSNPKKPRIELDIEKKVKCLSFLIRAYLKIWSKFKKQDPDMNNLRLSIQITQIIFTMHTIIKQKAAGFAGNMERKTVGKEFDISIGGKKTSIKFEDAKEAVTTSATDSGLVYKQYANNDKDNWYGTVGPYLNFFLRLWFKIE